jgi:GT2 family glycosyltransferase
MCSYNRSKQTYHTLRTIANSRYNNIQVILVDDSTSDLLDNNILAAFPFSIDLIRIDPKAKTWCNPCINHNIAFQFIRGKRVIVQNPEVCHVGDVLAYTNDHLKEDNYMVFNVIACKNFKANEEIYRMGALETTIFETAPHLFANWLQHTVHRNNNLHFLIACSAVRLREFSYDMAFGAWYDDDDFVFQMTVVGGLRIENIDSVAGIHLYHASSGAWNLGHEKNTALWITKVKHFRETGEYLEVSDADTIQDFEKRWKILFMLS